MSSFFIFGIQTVERADGKLGFHTKGFDFTGPSIQLPFYLYCLKIAHKMPRLA